MSPMPSLRGVLPSTVALAERWRDTPDAAVFPGEEGLLVSAGPARSAELITTRDCARTALAVVGCEPTAILRDSAGAPIWPEAIIGSMTHCVSYRAAAVGRMGDVAGIGIDAEPHTPLPPVVVSDIASRAEREHLQLLTEEAPGVYWDRLLFSAKESIYKVWYPSRQTWLGFMDVRVEIDSSEAAFHGIVGSGPHRLALSGRYVIAARHVLTAVILTA